MLFKLSVPLDSRLVGIVHDVALRIGHEHGFAPRDAESIARAVDEAVAEGLHQPAPDATVDLSFHSDARRIEIGIFYPAPSGLRDLALRHGRPQSEAVQTMDSVEQHLERGMVHHRLTRRLPARRKH